MSGQILRSVAAAALVVALSAGAASAGGWATITADTGNPQQPNAGETFTFGFTVLQHGVTPAGWVGATFVAINGTSGQRVEAKATGQGADGHFVATVMLPEGGFWTWQVELTDLIVETAPQPLVVAAADGTVPAMTTAAMIAALERVRTEVRSDFQNQLFAETDQVRAEVTNVTNQLIAIRSQRDALDKQLDELTAAVAADGAPAGGVPIFAVVAIAVLSGAISGFAMTLLARGRGEGLNRPSVIGEETSPGAIPATR
jgi:hypothetical protein